MTILLWTTQFSILIETFLLKIQNSDVDSLDEFSFTDLADRMADIHDNISEVSRAASEALVKVDKIMDSLNQDVKPKFNQIKDVDKSTLDQAERLGIFSSQHDTHVFMITFLIAIIFYTR